MKGKFQKTKKDIEYNDPRFYLPNIYSSTALLVFIMFYSYVLIENFRGDFGEEFFQKYFITNKIFIVVSAAILLIGIYYLGKVAGRFYYRKRLEKISPEMAQPQMVKLCKELCENDKEKIP